MTSPSPTVSRLAITGNVTLTSIGETAQLTGTATFSDGTTKDVTSDGRWSSSDARIVTLSPTGLLTAVGFGSTFISFAYQTRTTGIAVTATTPGTVAIRGRVREPGVGSLSNVLVVETMSGRSTTTTSAGDFSFGDLPRLPAHLKVQIDEYEPAEVDVTGLSVDLPVQHIVRLTAGETVKPARLGANGLVYTVGVNRCIDCRLIRVVVPQAGTVHVKVTWVTSTTLSLYAEGQVVNGGTRELNAEVPIDAPREVLMYLGGTPPNGVITDTTFTFETSMR